MNRASARPVRQKPRRTPVDTRQRLLKAGIEAFARFGPEEVGIRRLASAAGVNSAALSYYFGGKQGYYRAVLRHLVQEIGGLIREAAATARASLDSSPNPQSACDALRSLIRQVVRSVLTKPQAEAVAAIIWRELLRPSSGFDIVYRQMIRPVHEVITELVAAAMATTPDDPDALLLAHSLWGQVAIFRLGFHVLRRRLKLRESRLSQEWIERICNTIDEVVMRLLLSPQKVAQATGTA